MRVNNAMRVNIAILTIVELIHRKCQFCCVKASIFFGRLILSNIILPYYQYIVQTNTGGSEKLFFFVVVFVSTTVARFRYCNKMQQNVSVSVFLKFRRRQDGSKWFED